MSLSAKVTGWTATAGRWLIVLTFLATPMVTLRPGGSVTFGDVLLFFSFCSAALVVLLRRKLPEIPVWIWGGGSLLVLSIALTIVFPPDSVSGLVDTYFENPYTSSASTGLRLVLALIALPLAAGVLIDRLSIISTAAWAWLAGAAASCAVAVFDGVLGTDLQTTFAQNADEVRGYMEQEPTRYVGLGVHPTSFAVTSVMALPVLFAAMRTPRRVMYLSPVLLLLLLGIVFSGSRVGYIGIVVVSALSLWLDKEFRRTVLRPDFRTWLPLAAVGLVTLFFFFAGTPTPTPDEVTKQSSSSRLDPTSQLSAESNNVRVEFWENSVDFVIDRPFVGYGFEWIEAAHNIYLQLLVSGGILALVAFLWIYLGYIRRGITLRGRFSGQEEGIRLAAVISLASYLVMGLVQTDLLDRYLYLPAGLILALSVLSAKDGSATTSETSK